MMATREALRRLVDRLPESELQAAQRFLEYLHVAGSDPVLQAFIQAPEDDEVETPEEAAAVSKAREDVARGDVLSTDQLRQALGL